MLLASEPMEIRPATPADALLLARLNAHVHALHVEAEPLRYRSTDLAEVEARMHTILAEGGGSEALIAFEADEARAHLIFRELRREPTPFTHADACLMVDQLAVVDTRRRAGLGRALMDALAELASDRGIDAIRLDVRSHNLGAAAFYEALGYVELGRRLERRL